MPPAPLSTECCMPRRFCHKVSSHIENRSRLDLHHGMQEWVGKEVDLLVFIRRLGLAYGKLRVTKRNGSEQIESAKPGGSVKCGRDRSRRLEPDSAEENGGEERSDSDTDSCIATDIQLMPIM